MIGRNDPCWCGSGKKWKKCHFPELPSKNLPHLTMSGKELTEYYLQTYGIIIKTEEQIRGIKEASILTARILDALVDATKEGVTTKELDLLAIKLCKDAGAKAASLGYGTPPFSRSYLYLD